MAGTKRVILPYAPREAFLPYHNRTARFCVGVAHRRCGKTVATINDMIKKAVLTDKEQYRAGYVAPFFNQAKDIAWEYLKRYAAPVLARVNEGDAWVELVNGSRIRVYGADNPDRLRGGYFDDVTLDEYADMYPGIWGSIIRPMLADRQGTATFIGTPKGRNAFFDLYERAGNDPDWSRFMLRASATGILPQKELINARRDMTPEQYEQEFECSFEAGIVGAYYGREMAECERSGRIRPVPVVDGFPVHTAWDLGKGQNMPVWCFQTLVNEIRVVDYICDYQYTIEKMADELNVRGYHGIDYVPHDAKAPSLETGRTRVETLRLMGRKPALVPMHHVDDGINAVRRTLPSVWFDRDKCRDGLEALRQYHAEYDKKAKVFKNVPNHDWASHPADAMRYLAMAWKEQHPDVAPVAKPPVKEMKHYTLNELWDLPRHRERVRL